MMKILRLIKSLFSRLLGSKKTITITPSMNGQFYRYHNNNKSYEMSRFTISSNKSVQVLQNVEIEGLSCYTFKLKDYIFAISKDLVETTSQPFIQNLTTMTITPDMEGSIYRMKPRGWIARLWKSEPDYSPSRFKVDHDTEFKVVGVVQIRSRNFYLFKNQGKTYAVPAYYFK